MFQNYSHSAAVDPELPYDEFTGPDITLFSYLDGRETSGMSFKWDSFEGFMAVAGLEFVPRNSVLAVSIANLAVPAGLTTLVVEFYAVGAVPLAVIPVCGNGLGTHTDAVPIPQGASFAHIKAYGLATVGGQVRVVSREVIPYQPLKG